MGASRNNYGRLLATVFACGALAAAAPAHGQSDVDATGNSPGNSQGNPPAGPPTALTPPPSAPGIDQGTDQGTTTVQPVGTDAPAAPAGVVADQLAAPSIDGAGILSAGSGGFPGTLWQGTSAATAARLLTTIASTTSPTLQDLTYRLLATGATPPSGLDTPGLLLALRAERLTTVLGRADVALGLLRTMPPAQESEDVAKVSADLAFLAGDIRTACAVVGERQSSWQSAYWDQGSATCHALNGEGDQAQLSLDVLRDAKVKDDGFAALVELALGNDAKMPDQLPSPQTMALALLAKIGQGLPKQALAGAGLPITRAVALNAGFPLDVRVVAAEKAATYGAISAEQLADAYMATPLDQDDRDSPLSRADAAGGAKGRAILFAAAHEAALVPAKANFLSVLLNRAPRGDLYRAVARAAEQLLLEVPPSPDLKPVAVDFARAMYALDRPDQAAKWLDVADPDDAAALVPLAHIAADGSAPPWGETGLVDRLGGTKPDKSQALRKAVIASQLLAAEGTPVPDSLLLPLLDAKVPVAALPGPGTLIESAAAGKRLGMTILAILSGLGDQGAAAPGQTVAQAVKALRAVGQPEDARHLAIDAAIAAGL